MGVLASIPKIMQLNITVIELAVDASVAFLFSLYVWYYNIYKLPKYTKKQFNRRFFSLRLVYSFIIGIVLMLLLVSIHQLLFPRYNFSSMILMYQFRGVLINLTICMFLFFLYQNHNSQLIMVELEKVKSDHLGAQFELLKQQINPHFLFNSLSTLKSMIEIGDPHSNEFILKLSDFYRFTLEKRKQDVIPIQEELKILHSYIYLLRARFEDGLHLVDDTARVAHTGGIPPFTLQLLVENCIKHNVVTLDNPLTIKVYYAENVLVVENRISRKNKPEVSIEKNSEIFRVKLPLIHEYHNN